MSVSAPKVSGGRCILVKVTKTDEGGTTWNEHARHVSTATDIDAGRFVSIHICDYCGCLFAPSKENP